MITVLVFRQYADFEREHQHVFALSIYLCYGFGYYMCALQLMFLFMIYDSFGLSGESVSRVVFLSGREIATFVGMR